MLEINGVELVDQDAYLKFNQTFDSFKFDLLKINITFENPLIYKSGIYVKDYIKTTVLEPTFFNIYRKIPGTSKVSNQTLETLAEIPKMFDYTVPSKNIVGYSDVAYVALSYYAISSFVLSAWMQLSLKLLFGCNEFSQLFVFHMLINIDHPANS